MRPDVVHGREVARERPARSAPCVARRRGGRACSQPGDHGTTFGGGPLVAAAALATLDVIDDDALLARVRVLGDRFRVGLERAARARAASPTCAARGLMVGADLPPSAPGAPKVVRDGAEPSASC